MKKTTIIAATLVLLPVSVQATERGEPNEEAGSLIEENSEACGYTFYSDGDDRIDLQGKIGRPCFDLKSGRDIIGLDPESFPEGTEVYTGPGRDIVLLTDGPDLVESFDDLDEEIDLRGGDDTLRMQGVIAEGLSRPGRADQTLVRTGAGNDKMIFDLEGLRGTVRLRSPNIVLDTEGEGNFKGDMSCGRFLDPHTVDLTIPSGGKTKAIELDLEGCGVSIGRQASPLKLIQDGGRLNLSVRSPAYDLEHAPAEIVTRVENGSALSASFSVSSASSSFEWRGFGVVATNFDFVDSRMGGVFDIETSKTFFGTADVSRGNASISAIAGEVAELVLLGSEVENDMQFSIASPKVKISWYPGAGNFPSVKTPMAFSYAAYSEKKSPSNEEVIAAFDRQFQRELDRYNAKKARSEVSNVSKTARRDADAAEKAEEAPLSYDMKTEAQRTEALYSAKAARPVIEDVYATSRDVEFSIHRSGSAGCVDVVMADLDGTLPQRIINCDDPVFSGRAAKYELVEVKMGNHSTRIDINGDSGFRVDRLFVKN